MIANVHAIIWLHKGYLKYSALAVLIPHITHKTYLHKQENRLLNIVMKNQDDLKSFWGSSLKKIDISVPELFDLNTTTLHFLRDVGLPDDATLRLQHTLEVNFYTDAVKLRSYDYEGTKYLIIGDDEGSYFCIDREHEGIFAIEYDTECMAFVNSDIEKFLKCVQIFIQCKQRFDEGAGRIIPGSRLQMPGPVHVVVDCFKSGILRQVYMLA